MKNKTIIVGLFKNKETDEYIADVTGEIKDGKRTHQIFDARVYEKIDEVEFEVKDEKWNLTTQRKERLSKTFDIDDEAILSIRLDDVKKLKLLICQDFEEMKLFPYESGGALVKLSRVEEIIRQRFG